MACGAYSSSMGPSGNGIMTKPGTSTAGVTPNVPVSRALVASNSSGCCTIACQVTPLVLIIVLPSLSVMRLVASDSPGGGPGGSGAGGSGGVAYGSATDGQEAPVGGDR